MGRPPDRCVGQRPTAPGDASVAGRSTGGLDAPHPRRHERGNRLAPHVPQQPRCATFSQRTGIAAHLDHAPHAKHAPACVDHAAHLDHAPHAKHAAGHVDHAARATAALRCRVRARGARGVSAAARATHRNNKLARHHPRARAREPPAGANRRSPSRGAALEQSNDAAQPGLPLEQRPCDGAGSVAQTFSEQRRCLALCPHGARVCSARLRPQEIAPQPARLRRPSRTTRCRSRGLGHPEQTDFTRLSRVFSLASRHL